MKKITEEWLKAATDDLSVIMRIITDEHLTHMVAFHSQQAIEKSLKAVMEEYEIGPARIHNLERYHDPIAFQRIDSQDHPAQDNGRIPPNETVQPS